MRQTVNVRGLHVRMATGTEFVEAQIIDQNHDQVGAHCHGSSVTVALDKRRQVECNDSSLLACLRRAQHPQMDLPEAVEGNTALGGARPRLPESTPKPAPYHPQSGGAGGTCPQPLR